MKSRHASCSVIVGILTLCLTVFMTISPLAIAQTAGQGTPPTQQPPVAGSPVPPAASTQFSIGESNVIRVPTDTTTITATGLTGLDKVPEEELRKLAASIALSDRGVARGPAASGSFALSQPEFVGRAGADGLRWRVPVNVNVPLGTSQVRLLSVVLGMPPNTRTFAVEYTVSSAKPTVATTWTPRAASDVWTISWSDLPAARILEVSIENPDEPLANLRLAQSTLKDASGHTLGVDRWRLMENPTNTSNANISVAPSSIKTLFLRLDPAESGNPHGTFDGVLRFAVDGSPTTKDVALKVQASSRGRRVMGIALTLAGLLMTILASAIMQPQTARLQARRAAAAMREAIGQFERELARAVPADVPMNRMNETTARLRESLTDKELDRAGKLPLGFMPGPGQSSPADPLANLKSMLDEISKILEGLYVILRSGFPKLLDALKTTAADQRKAVLDLFRELDSSAASVAGPQDAKAKVEDVHRRIPAMTRAAQAGVAAVSAERDVTVSELDFSIRALSVASWLIWALIALGIGAAWIGTDVDYGTPVDLVSSFLWGFGMTTFGAGIQTLTPANVATQVSVKVPK